MCLCFFFFFFFFYIIISFFFFSFFPFSFCHLPLFWSSFTTLTFDLDFSAVEYNDHPITSAILVPTTIVLKSRADPQHRTLISARCSELGTVGDY